ncbi:hypothetical protein BD414DRAFT_511750 [Trametes punicea]|nr:hypothetical protein BD414DRAFT_511750 [Trametes punicea]
MLRGWVLTDTICPKCGKVPMMRSPSAAAVATQFCVNCDPAPGSGNTAGISSAQTARPSAVSQRSSALDASSVSTISYSTRMSRASTPPTDVSSAPGSPTFAPVMDTTELLRRRQQSDTASAEIGRRMLKGWAMLADECPNPNCYGIPLVRPPKVQATVDPRKECVICGIVYADERDALGRDRLTPMQPALAPANTYRAPDPAPAGPSSATVDKGKTRARHEASTSADNGWNQPSRARPEPFVTPVPEAPISHSSTSSALEVSARSLERSLLALSARLDGISCGPIIDPTPIGVTADTIAKVSQALTQVKQLLWSEDQARTA